MSSEEIGVFTPKSSLSATYQNLIEMAIDVSKRAFCYRSNFPVGSAILAAQRNGGDQQAFAGCNVENIFFPATICAERNAATTAVASGRTRFMAVAIYCDKHPGGQSCGVCRQVLTEFGTDADLLNIVDREGNVRLGKVGQLLPSAKGKPFAFDALSADYTRKLIKRVLAQKEKSYVPYSKQPRGAVVVAKGPSSKSRIFGGCTVDNASYGASVSAESQAMMCARAAGCTQELSLYVTVDEHCKHNPIDGECLQILREFGTTPSIFLVAPDKSFVQTSLDELCPENFGPQSL